MRKAGWILSVVLLLVSGFVGLMNGAREWDDPGTRLQSSVRLGVVLYGMLGVVAGVGLARRRPWSVTIAAAWAITVTYVATVASFAFHDPNFSTEGTVTGTIAAGVATALIGAFVVWMARIATRPRAAQIDAITENNS